MATINGGFGSDNIDGTTADDTITAGGGNDTVQGGAGNDTIFGDGNLPPGGASGTMYYEFFNTNGTISNLAGLNDSDVTLDGTGYVSNTDVDALALLHGNNGSGSNFNQFGVRWYGTIDVPPGGGTYTFSTRSDDGSSLSIGGTQVVDNDGLHGLRTRSGTITLTEGQHDIFFDFFENGGGEAMEVTVSGTGISGTQDLFATSLLGDPDDNTQLAAGDDSLTGGSGDDTIDGQDGDDTLIGDGQVGVTGLTYEFWNVNVNTVDNIPTTNPDATGFVDEINIGALTAQHSTDFSGSNPERYAIRYSGEITITTAGTYTFFTASDDGSTLSIDGTEVVDNDFLQPVTERSGTIFLNAGTYDLDLEYFELTGNEGFTVSIQGPDTGGAKQEIMASGVVTSEDPAGSTPGNDTLIGGAGSDTFTGGDGNDLFQGFGGGSGVNDTITDFEGESAVDTPVDIVDLSPHFTRWTIAQDNFTQSGSDVIVTLPDGATVTLNNILVEDLTPDNTLVPCFTPGTRIATPTGQRPVEELEVGDLVCTQDRGLQPIRWIGRREISGARMQAMPRFRPIIIKKGAFGLGVPGQDIRVSPQHRFLVRAAAADVMFGSTEVLVAAKLLVDDDRVVEDTSCAPTTYIHLLFDRHEIIFAEGQPTESFHPGEASATAFDEATRDELFALFPQLRAVAGETAPGMVAARPSLKASEARALRVVGGGQRYK